MQVKCNLCGNTKFIDMFTLSTDRFYTSTLKKRNLYTIARCEDCGLIFVKEPVALEELENIYSEGYYKGRDHVGYKDYCQNLFLRWVKGFVSDIKSLMHGFKSFLRKPEKLKQLHRFIRRSLTLKKIPKKDIKIINSYVKKPGKLLDVGCAMGLFLADAKKSGWDVTGVEISEFASNYAREKLKLNVFTGQLEGLIRGNKIEKDSFNITTLWDTLEHVSDPSSLLKEIHSVLKEGGLLFLSTLNIDSLRAKEEGKNWHFFRPPKHLFYYSEKTLKQFLYKAGFKITLDDDFKKGVVVIGAKKVIVAQQE